MKSSYWAILHNALFRIWDTAVKTHGCDQHVEEELKHVLVIRGEESLTDRAFLTLNLVVSKPWSHPELNLQLSIDLNQFFFRM